MSDSKPVLPYHRDETHDHRELWKDTSPRPQVPFGLGYQQPSQPQADAAQPRVEQAGQGDHSQLDQVQACEDLIEEDVDHGQEVRFATRHHMPLDVPSSRVAPMNGAVAGGFNPPGLRS